MSIEAGWYPVDETGHVPYVAAELPLGHEVYLDASGNMGGMRLIEQASSSLVEAIAPDNDAAETPAQGG